MKNKLFFLVVVMISYATTTMAQVPFCVTDTFANMSSIANSSNDVVRINNKIYTIEAWSTPKTLTEYNISTGIANIISNPPFLLGETSIASYNNNLYFFGGYTGSTSNLAKMYNISTNTWTSLANMPVSITQTSAITLNNYIYITGGTLGSTIQYFLKYDPALNSYTTLAVPTVMFSNSKLILYNNTIYCLGGHGNGSISNKLSIYNSTLNTWSNLAQMPSGRTKIAATVWGSYLYVFGGAITPLFTAQFNYYAYDFLNNTWSTSNETIPVSVMSGAVEYNDTIYLPNGSSSKKYYCGMLCSQLITNQPINQYLNTSNNAQFTGSTSTTGTVYQWQTNSNNLGWQNISANASYSGVTSNTLAVNNVQVSNHLQPFRVIASAGSCIDTSNVATINITDTCITTLISVSDTLIINASLTGLTPPNNINTIKVFPNPASTHITIDYGNFSTMNGYTLKITNSLSQVVFTTPINQQSSYIDLSTWTGNGIYFMQIIDTLNNTIENRKIVLQ